MHALSPSSEIVDNVFAGRVLQCLKAVAKESVMS